MVFLWTFGGLSLVGDGLSRSASQPRRLSLLVLLARGRERGVSRDKLLAHLWPESPADHARHALEQLVYTTRRDLGRSAVLSEGGQLRLDPRRVRADCWEFEILLERGELERAVHLYVGPFLDGVYLSRAGELERWVDRERAVLAERFEAALEALAMDAEGCGDPVTAAAWWRRLAAAQPLNARVARRLMKALVRAGDRAGALRHARAHAILVREELGVEPDGAFTAFVDRLAGPAAVRVPVVGVGGPSPMGGAARGLRPDGRNPRSGS